MKAMFGSIGPAIREASGAAARAAGAACIAAAVLACGVVPSTAMAQANSIESVASVQQGNTTYVRIGLKNAPTTTPVGFSVSNPPRIAFDFVDTDNRSGQNSVELPQGDVRSVAIVQGAIPQDMKWQVSNQQHILDTYETLHREALGADLIVWPESALPDVANRYGNYIASVWSAARRHGSDVVMGVMRVEAAADPADDRYFNSMLALAGGEPAFYDKRQLVPFGEFFPVPQLVRNWLRLMNLPYSDFTRGARHQQPFEAAGMHLAPNICYEDAYPGLLREEILASHALVTVTNDAWFGRSSARYQHLQIGRMRALESRRYLIRAANDGVSALIGPHGDIVARASEFTPTVLRAQMTPRTGATPYLAAGNWPVLCLALAMLALHGLQALRRRRTARI